MNNNKYSNFLVKLYFLLLVALPIICVLVFSFTDKEFHFTLNNYLHLNNIFFYKALISTIYYSIIITFITISISYPIAYLLSKNAHKELFLTLIIIPSFINILLIIYAFISIFSANSFLFTILSFLKIDDFNIMYSEFAFIVVNCYIFLPITILTLENTFSSIDKGQIIAGMDLGANKFQIFRKIVIPHSKKGILNAFNIIFIPSMTLFMVNRLIAGNNIITLGSVIEEYFLVINNYHQGSSIVMILFIFLLLILIVIDKKFQIKIGKKNK